MKLNISNTFKVIAACLLIVVGTGCRKFLDQQPITDVDASVVFKDVPSTYKALAAAYSRLVGDAGYGIRLSLYYPLDNDEMQGPSGAADNDRRDIARYAATPGNARSPIHLTSYSRELNLPISALPIFRK